MAFENISKGEFTAKDNSLMIGGKVGQQAIFCKQNFDYKVIDVEMLENTQFAVYCFNLQQRYDISKLEEAVNVLEELLMTGQLSDNYSNSVEQLLKEIKK